MTHPLLNIRYAIFCLLLLSAAALSGCEDPFKLQTAALSGKDDRPMVMADTFTINAETIVLHDSLAEGSDFAHDNDIHAGSIIDPVLGPVSAVPVFQPLPSGYYALPSSPLFDSVVIKFPVDTLFIGRAGVEQTFQLRKLTDSISAFSRYDARSVTGYQTDSVLASAKLTTVKKSTQDTLVFKALSGSNSNLEKYANQLLALGANFNIDSLHTNFVFRKQFYGLALTASNLTADAAIINMYAPGTIFRVYFHTAAVATKDSVALTLSPFTGYYARYYSKITFNAAALSSSLNANHAAVSSKALNNRTMIAPLLGLATRITVPGLSNLRAQVGRGLAVTRAELVLPVSDTTSGTQNYYPTPYLTASDLLPGQSGWTYLLNVDNYLGSDVANSLRFLYASEQKGAYILPVSQYVSQIVGGIKSNNGFVVTHRPTASRYNGATYVHNDLSRSVIIGPDGLAAGNNRMKLRIWYVNLQ
ncbi:MAG: DUF4270 family protein [Bacteroidota bacterium]